MSDQTHSETLPETPIIDRHAKVSATESLIRRAAFDPGHWLPRGKCPAGDGYEPEPLYRWQARAIMAALDLTGFKIEVPKPDLPKVYLVAYGTWHGWDGGDIGGYAVLADGHVLWSHVSSSVTYLRGDLTGTFADRRASLALLFPEGYEIVEVGHRAIPEHLQAAMKTYEDAQDGDGR